MELTECVLHGKQEETFVCTHLAGSIQTGERVGFYFASEPRGDAWCQECEEERLKYGGAGGDWNERSEAFADITLICGSCYDKVKTLNYSATPSLDKD